MFKKIICLALSLIAVLSLTGCQAGGGDNETDLGELKEKMVAADENMPEMESIDSDMENAERLFTNLSSIEYVKVEEYFYMYSTTGSAHELAVIKLRNKDDVKDTVNTINDHVAQRVEIFKTYAKDQVETAENTQILTYGNFVVMIMSPDGGSIKSVCDEMLK